LVKAGITGNAANERAKSSGSKDKSDEPNTEEMLMILMQSQERMMEVVLKATVSPSKEKEDEGMTFKKERERN
jgi:hypothetical protein